MQAWSNVGCGWSVGMGVLGPTVLLFMELEAQSLLGLWLQP